MCHFANFIRARRFALVAICLFTSLTWLVEGSNELFGQEEFPYEAVIVGDEGVVHSGPGETHYGTDRLAPGTRVKVFSHDPGGWMAIRPPKGSFSLIQLDQVEMINDRIARVINDGTMAWVGTRLKAVKKPMYQVRLKKGELIRVLGSVDRKKFDLTNEEPDWLQIAPPKGEFRWIAGSCLRPWKKNRRQEKADEEIDDLQIDIGEESGFETIDSTSETTQASSSNRTESVRPFDEWDDDPVLKDKTNSTSSDNSDNDWSMEVEDSEADKNAGYSGWKPARQPISNFVEQRSRFVSDVNQNQPFDGSTNHLDGNGLAGQMQSVPSGFASNRNPISDPNARSPIFDASGSIAAASQMNSGTMLHAPDFGNTGNNSTGNLPLTGGDPIHNLELMLSNEMAKKEPGNWNLMPLAAEAERLRSQSRSQEETTRLNHILEKIRKCREIKAGFQATGDDDSRNLQTRRNGNPYGSAGRASATANSTNNVLYNYDASGYLFELIRDNGTSPSTFVLKNEQGEITHHVAAPPGLNLRRYLNQRVGIIGNRGYNQQLRLEHVTAERITTVRR